MAQTGFTPIVTYNTATASTAPSASNLVQGELAVNVTDKKIYTKDSGGSVVVVGASGDVAGPASSTNLAISTFSGTGGKTLLDNPNATISAGVITATGFAGALTGNASTATTLATARNIAGVSFNGSADIAIPLANLSDTSIATPVVDQILKYNGLAWVNGNPNSISGGSGVEFFNATPIITASGTNNALQILTLSQTPVTTAEQTTTTTSIVGTVASSAWLSPAMGRTTLDAGIWDYTVFASVSSVGGAITTITRQMYSALPFVTGTVTTTGTGTSRTATASAGTPFATTEITASATNTVASYLQTPQGLYQITARASDTVVTISTLTTYVNESAVAGTVWKLLFAMPVSPALTTTIAQYDNVTTQGAFTVTALTKLGGITFATSTNAGRVVTTTYNGTTRNTHILSPFAVLHNQLGGLQGGTSNESYHLTSTEYTGTGTGTFVRASTPTLITPVLGVATATSINKMAITAPATSSTLAVADGKTFTASKTLTLTGTDSTTMTFPTTSATIARTDAAQTFTGTQTFGETILGTNAAKVFASGGVSIGNTTDPSATNLSVTGTGAFSYVETSTSVDTGKFFGTAFTNTYQFGAGILVRGGGNSSVYPTALFQRYDGVTNLTLDGNGALILAGSTAQKATGTTWTNPSDVRLKNNIKPYVKGVDELMQIAVKEWVYNGKGGTVKGTKGLGIIADEVMLVLPDTVDTYDAKLNESDEDTTKIKKFDATEITWLLVKAVQELKAEIDLLKGTK